MKSVEPVPPDVIADRYVVERLLGRGGMAVVYLCTDRLTGSHVAVKVLRREIGSAVIIERFLREIDLTSHLDHPRIPKVLDSGLLGDLPYYVMTYVPGESLRAKLDREKQLPVEVAVTITNEITPPLMHAHANGIVHRDIKPENILIAPGGIYLLDLGVARAIIESADDRLTSTGVAIGTPAYMSPEQALSDKGLDARSDIYSLACVTYEMIAGIPPFVGATPQAVMTRRFVAPAPPLGETRDGVPAHVEAAVARALMRAPADRWQTVEDFSSALRAATFRRASPFTTLVRQMAHRKRALAAVLALPILAGLVMTIIFISGLLPSRAFPRELDIRRTAVLYFDDHSPDSSLRHIASGLTTALIQQLSAVHGLSVVSVNGVKPFRNAEIRVDSIAALLNVGSLIGGTVQRSGNSIRVTAHLIDGSTATQLGSTMIEQPVGDLFSLEDSVSLRVADLLRPRIGRQIYLREATADTRSARAKELLYQAEAARDDAQSSGLIAGTTHMASGLALLETSDSLLRAAELADRNWVAPVIARGWVALERGVRQRKPERGQSVQRALQLANRALLLDADSAKALELRGTVNYHVALGAQTQSNVFMGSLDRARADLEEAVRRDRTLAAARGTLSRVYSAQGNIVLAQQRAREAFTMDAYLTHTPDILHSLYGATLLAGSYDASLEWCQNGRRRYPNDPRFIECRLALLAEDTRRAPSPRLAWSLVAKADSLDPPASAIAAGRAWLPMFRQMMAAAVSARSGDRQRALAVAAKARRSISENLQLSPAEKHELNIDLMYEEAYLLLLTGDRETAVALLNEYVSERSYLSNLVRTHARWSRLRSHPAFPKAR